ncbi:DUF2817 domain-containing protein [Microcoleus sp. FACHB-672]|uniref:DUF2817 domain-containing protein n=1 Tax=Microcoleus sp. FACHB-672 TaxID=2692825 RepID=UPI0016822C96|nr:DUF2817 domain-containing protein [Microcoleus sp. FACHB-672]MBD2041664.1 DUF2817 domain-containing protein [Microcoleus sp. FACHB-672]
MSNTAAFSPDYFTARHRFRCAASAFGCSVETFGIDEFGQNGEKMTIDVAILGSLNPKRVLIVSSGLHGVEGFFGSAVQIALLEGYLQDYSFPPDTALVLLHALNPYGFAWRRRCNEDNADLNRNFLLAGEEYHGSPENYPKLDSFFNPTSPPSQFEPFLIKAMALILRYGMPALKNTLPVGQYDFPKGLFFGGNSPSETQQILAENLPRWVGEATNVIHLDFHTGLGRKFSYKLLIDVPADSEQAQQLIQDFGSDVVSPLTTEGIVYPTRGGLGTWCQAKFPHTRYDFLTAEFGTYPIIQVVQALRAENRAHWWGTPDHPAWERAKQQLVEIFAPADPRWRETAVSQGINLVKQACKIISQ